MKEKGIIRLQHVYSQSPARVWRAITEPSLVARWWAAGDIRAEVGHRFEMEMGHWGKQPFEVLTVERERLFRYRMASPALDTIITWELTTEGTGTRLTLIHEGFDLDAPGPRQAFEFMKPGWAVILEKLATAID